MVIVNLEIKMENKFNTCLLIDDGIVDIFINEKIILLADFADNVIIKNNAADALKLLKEMPIPPDIIFLDIKMPEMDGFDFLSEYDALSIEKDNIKIFMLSSTTDPVEREKAHKHKSVTELLIKPLHREALNALMLTPKQNFHDH